MLKKKFRQSRNKKAVLLLDVNRDQHYPAINPIELNRTQNSINRNGYEFQMLACAEEPNDYVVKEASRSAGVLVTGILNENWIAFLCSLSVPVVVVGEQGGLGSDKLKTVYRDAKNDVFKAVDYFLAQGMTRIGIF